MIKRKRHNPTKRLLTQSRIAVSDLMLTMRLSVADKGVDVRKYKTNTPVAIGQSVATALGSCAFKWGVLLVVYAQESNGKLKTVTQWTRLAATYRHDELTDWLRAEHQAMIDNAKRFNQVIDAGWLALPVPPAFVGDAAELELIDKLTGWLE